MLAKVNVQWSGSVGEGRLPAPGYREKERERILIMCIYNKGGYVDMRQKQGAKSIRIERKLSSL